LGGVTISKSILDSERAPTWQPTEYLDPRAPRKIRRSIYFNEPNVFANAAAKLASAKHHVTYQPLSSRPECPAHGASAVPSHGPPNIKRLPAVRKAASSCEYPPPLFDAAAIKKRGCKACVPIDKRRADLRKGRPPPQEERMKRFPMAEEIRSGHSGEKLLS